MKTQENAVGSNTPTGCVTSENSEESTEEG